MSSSHTAAATVELPTILSELGSSNNEAGPSTQRSPKTDDLELMTMPSVIGREAGERDPLLLRQKIILDQEIDGLRQYAHLLLSIISPADGSSRQKGKGKRIAKFYSAQNEHINDLLKPLSAHTADAKQDAKDMALKIKLAVNLSLAANVVLAAVQLYAAISSLSLALFASCIDASER